ncbi:MAG: hypothetical protein ACREIT_00845 [Tepidisphaeraceae bacterium]
MRQPLSRVVALVAFFCLPASLPARADIPADPVGIERRATAVTRHTFDPKNHPANMPPLKPGEAAVCQNNFRVASSFGYQLRELPDAGQNGRVVASANLENVTITLDLIIAIWNPTNATAKIKAHEEGHREISQRVYDTRATDVARTLARQYVGRELRVEGATFDACAAEAQKRVEQFANELGARYMGAVAEVAGRVNDTYDDITDHGKDLKLSEADAIERSFKIEAERAQVVESKKGETP